MRGAEPLLFLPMVSVVEKRFQGLEDDEVTTYLFVWLADGESMSAARYERVE
jgi:hypothetical protein